MHGLFSCVRCGSCCRGRGGIWLNRTGATAAARALALSPAQFETGFLQPGPGRLWALRTGADGFCSCWESRTRGCLIQAAKPVMCRDWPLFYYLLVDEQVFNEARCSCPGLDAGATWAQFVAWGRRQLGGRVPPRSYRAWLDPSFRS